LTVSELSFVVKSCGLNVMTSFLTTERFADITNPIQVLQEVHFRLAHCSSSIVNRPVTPQVDVNLSRCLVGILEYWDLTMMLLHTHFPWISPSAQVPDTAAVRCAHEFRQDARFLNVGAKTRASHEQLNDLPRQTRHLIIKEVRAFTCCGLADAPIFTSLTRSWRWRCASMKWASSNLTCSSPT
jgi:hypothetical protein